MNRIIIYEFSPAATDKFSGETLIPRVTALEEVEHAWKSAGLNNNAFCVWADMTGQMMSELDFHCVPEDIPLIVHLGGLGDTFEVLTRLESVRRLSIRVFLVSSREDNFAGLKILSSMGVDCGLLLDGGKIDDDAFADLASYYYLSPAPHASMEPFDYIVKNLRQDRNLDIRTVCFTNPGKYIFAGEDLSFAFSREDLLAGRFAGRLDEAEEVGFEEEYKYKLEHYYRHFLDLDACSKCPAFKICPRNVEGVFSDCARTFGQVYEYAELHHGLHSARKREKQLCQL